MPAAKSESSAVAKPARRRRWFVLLVLGALALLLGATTVALLRVRSGLDDWVRRRLEQSLSRSLGGEVRAGELDLDLARLQVEVRDLRIAIPVEGGVPFNATAESARIRAARATVLEWLRGRLRLEEVVLHRPVLRFDKDFLDRRDRDGPSQRPLSLRIAHLEIHSGRFEYEDRAVPIELNVGKLDLEGRWDASRRAIAGRVRLEALLGRAPFVRPLPLELDGEIRLREEGVDLAGATVAGPGISATADASLEFSEDPALAGALRGSVDAEALAPWLDPALPPLAGRIDADLEFAALPGPLELRGDLAAPSALIHGVPLTALRSRVEFVSPDLSLRDLRVGAYGGQVEGDLRLTLSDVRQFTASMRGSGFDVGSPLWTRSGRLPLDGIGGFRADLAGDPSDFASWNGSGELAIEAGPGYEDRVATGGAGDLRLEAGRIELRDGAFRAGRFVFGLSVDLVPGFGGAQPETRVELDGVTESAGETQSTTVRILEAAGLAVPEVLGRPLAGRGDVGVVLRSGERNSVELTLGLRDGSWSGQPFDSADLDLVYVADRLSIERVSIRSGESELDGSLELLVGSSPGLIALDADARRIELGSLLSPFADPAGLAGRLSGSVQMVAGPGGLTGGGRVLVQDLVWNEERVEELTSVLVIEDNVIRGTGATAIGQGYDLRGDVAVDLASRTTRIAIDKGHLDLATFDPARRREIGAGGSVTFDGLIEAGPDGLVGDLRFEAPAPRLRGKELGALEGEVRLLDGRALVRAGADKGWTLDGSLTLDADAVVEATLRLDAASLNLVAAGGLPVWAVASGVVEVAGPLARPAELVIAAELSETELDLGGRSLRSTEPLRVTVRDGLLAAGPVELAGGEGAFVVGLRLGLADGSLEATARGDLDLGVLVARFPGLRASGLAALELEAGGTLDDPQIRGKLGILNGSLRLLGFPNGLAQTSAELVFDGQHATLREFRSLFGGGELRGTGELALEGGVVEAFAAELRATAVRMDYPEGFRGVYDAELQLRGDAEAALLSGRLRMLRGLYASEFDLAELLGLGIRDYEDTERVQLPENFLLGLTIVAPNNVWVRNKMAKIEAALDLEIGGDLERPEVGGRVQLLEGGTLTFRDVKYRITSGALYLLERDRINPNLDIRAGTRVSNHDILLHITGKLDRFEYALTSEPALAQQDIIALLATGRTLQDLSASAGGSGNVFSGDLAANYFAGALSDAFEGQLERLLGLERVRIDPLLVRGQADPTARVTLGKEVAEDLFIIASSDIGASERQIYTVEWNASRKFRMVAERGATGAIGGDFEYSDRFWIRRPEWARRPAATDPGSVPALVVRVAAVEFEGAPPGDLDELRRRVGLSEGDPLRRATLFEGREEIRRYFVRQGRLGVAVEVAELPSADDPGTSRVVYRIVPGPKTRISWQGVGDKDRKRLRSQLETFWIESIPGVSRLEDALAVVRDYFQERGFYTADVTAEETWDGEVRVLRLVVDTGKPVRIDSVVLEGVVELSPEQIRRQILTRKGTLFSRKFTPSVLRGDIVAVRNLYRDQGFLRARVAEPVVRLSAAGNSVSIILEVEEGPQFSVGEIEMPADTPFAVEDLRRWSGLSPDEAFSPGRLLAAESALRAELDKRGYPDVRVRGRYSLGESTASVTFVVEPGELRRVAMVEITGNAFTNPKVIRRQLLLRPGDLISRELLLRSQHALYQLGIFRSVRIEYLPIDVAEPSACRLVVQIEESRPLALVQAAGFDSEAGPRGSFSLVHNNLGGSDRTLGLQARLSDIERRVQLTASSPSLFGSRLPTLVNTLREFREEASFSLQRNATSVRVERRFSPRWTSFARYNFQRLDLRDITDPVAVREEKLENIQLGDLAFAVVHDTRDDPFLPTRGNYQTAEVRLFAGPLGSDAQFVKVFVHSSHTRKISRSQTYVTAARVGLAQPFGMTGQVPISERFFAGGDSTLRGFRRDEAGPRIGGQATGGQALLLLNQEWRFPIWDRLRGVLFYDAGNVYATLDDTDPFDLRHVLGAGLRLETPIGPLRVEYGRKLDRVAGESGGELFLAIGTAF